MHPGPMNRGVEIDSATADGRRSVIREQVACGTAIRMAVLAEVADHVRSSRNLVSDTLMFDRRVPPPDAPSAPSNIKVSDTKFQDGRRR
jgi:hypothetical protein